MRRSAGSWRSCRLGLSLLLAGCGGGEPGATDSDGETATSTGPGTTAGSDATGDATSDATGDDATGDGETGTSGPPPTGDPTTDADPTTGADGTSGGTTGDGAPGSPCGKPWPVATNTGIPAGTPALTVIEGDRHTEMDGQVFDAVELRGRLYVDHAGVTITRSLLIGDEYYAVYATEGASGLTIADTEVVGGLLLPNGATIARVHAHAAEDRQRDDGFIFAASDVVIEDSLIDGLRGSDGAHIDGIQVMGGTGVVLRNNWIDPSSPPVEGGGVNAAIFVSPENDAASADVTVECNMILGGESWYPLRLYDTTGAVIVRGNRFDRDFLGAPVYLVETVVTQWEDNAFADDGEVIPAP